MEAYQNWSKEIFYNSADERTRDWPLLGNPLPALILTTVWLLFARQVGPRIMRNRTPMKLQKVLLVVNTIQIIANTFVAYEFLDAGWLNNYNFQCQLCEYSRERDPMRIARACYIFFLLKIFDLVDTVLYVLRGKLNQMTFLHLYHHGSVLIVTWMIANYAPGGLPTFSEMLNAIVHVIMYGYYQLASLGPAYHPYLWWKKYLTLLQLIQFIVQFSHNVNALRIGCEYPHFIIYCLLPTVSIIFLLFVNFYIKSYIEKPSKKE